MEGDGFTTDSRPKKSQENSPNQLRAKLSDNARPDSIKLQQLDNHQIIVQNINQQVTKAKVILVI